MGACATAEVRYVDEDDVIVNVVDDVVPLPLTMKIATWVMHAIEWIAGVLLTRPRTLRAILAALVAIGFVGHNLTHPAHADVLNEIETTVEGATAGWLGNALALAQLIFLALAGLVIVTNIVTYYMAFETVRGMFSVILRSLLTIGIPYVVLQLAPTTVGAVIGYAMTISNDVTGGSAPPVTPDQVWMEGVTIGWGLFQNTFNAVMSSHYIFNLGNLGNDLGFDFNQALVDLVFLVASGVLCVIMIAAFTFIAVELVMAFLQAYFCLPLGAWALGFMATSPTSAIAMSWWRGLIQVLIRFIAVLACVSFAQNIGLQWEGDLARIVPNFNHLPAWNGQGAPPPVDIGALKSIISFALGAVALLYIVLNLPRLAESVLSGAPVLTGVNAVQVAGAPAMMTAGAIAGGAASGGLGAARGAYMGYAASMGGGSAVGLAGAVRGAASGFGTATGGGAAKGWNAASRQARNVNNVIDKMRRG